MTGLKCKKCDIHVPFGRGQLNAHLFDYHMVTEIRTGCFWRARLIVTITKGAIVDRPVTRLLHNNVWFAHNGFADNYDLQLLAHDLGSFHAINTWQELVIPEIRQHFPGILFHTYMNPVITLPVFNG
jgi:hypothetical protein